MINDTEIKGVILKGVGGIYSVYLDSGNVTNAKLRGILRKGKLVPCPGDYVLLEEASDEQIPYSIEEILPRSNSLRRPAIANLDTIIITTSATLPEPDYFFIDKMLILCAKANISAIICITKADLDISSARKVVEQYSNLGIPIFVVGKSPEFKDDFDLMREHINLKTITFAGQSGVGKSTLVNKIIKRECMDVGIVSAKNKRGKHTTRHSELFKVENGFLADTPGFSTLDLKDLLVTGEDVLKGFPELLQFEGECQFTGCRHLGEKGCAVNADKIEPGRLSRYRAFRKEMDAVASYEYKNINK